MTACQLFLSDINVFSTRGWTKNMADPATLLWWEGRPVPRVLVCVCEQLISVYVKKGTTTVCVNIVIKVIFWCTIIFNWTYKLNIASREIQTYSSVHKQFPTQYSCLCERFRGVDLIYWAQVSVCPLVCIWLEGMNKLCLNLNSVSARVARKTGILWFPSAVTCFNWDIGMFNRALLECCSSIGCVLLTIPLSSAELYELYVSLQPTRYIINSISGWASLGSLQC